VTIKSLVTIKDTTEFEFVRKEVNPSHFRLAPFSYSLSVRNLQVFNKSAIRSLLGLRQSYNSHEKYTRLALSDLVYNVHYIIILSGIFVYALVLCL